MGSNLLVWLLAGIGFFVVSLLILRVSELSVQVQTMRAYCAQCVTFDDIEDARDVQFGADSFYERLLSARDSPEHKEG